MADTGLHGFAFCKEGYMAGNTKGIYLTVENEQEAITDSLFFITVPESME